MLENTKLDIIGNQFFLNGKDVSTEIRTPEVSAVVSPVAAIKAVRVKLVELQREISKGKRIILDGRDIGTVVFPKAQVKIFLVASPEERARRRLNEYKEKGIEEDYESVLNSIKERDHIDSTRKESPLKKADDAIEIDSSKMSIDEVVEAISNCIDRKVIKERDHIDSTRKESPLKKADDAIEIDSSKMSIDEVVEAISNCIDRKVG